MRRQIGVLLTLTSLCCAAAPAVAHHGFDTEYDSAKKIGATGVIQKVEWTNPHMHVSIDVIGQDGKVKTYNLELTSPNTLQRNGWSKNDLLPGEKVTFAGHAADEFMDTMGMFAASPVISRGNGGGTHTRRSVTGATATTGDLTPADAGGTLGHEFGFPHASMAS